MTDKAKVCGRLTKLKKKRFYLNLFKKSFAIELLQVCVNYVTLTFKMCFKILIFINYYTKNDRVALH